MPTFVATIAPMIATPSAPPVWRNETSTPAPTPDFSRGVAVIAAAVTGAVEMPDADAADEERRKHVPEGRVDAEPREEVQPDAEARPSRPRPASANPNLSPLIPAIGETSRKMIVIGRNVAPAWIGV